MPTIAATIERALEGNDFAQRISVQAEKLASVHRAVQGLVDNPLGSIGALEQSLAELPMPALQVDSGFATVLSDLQAALPPDILGVAQNLASNLQELAGPLEDFLRVVKQTIAAVESIQRLTNLDLHGALPKGTERRNASTGLSEDSAKTSEPTSNAPANGAGESVPGYSTQLCDSLAEIEAVYAMLPSPLTVEGVLAALNRMLTQPRLRFFFPRPIPILNDLKDTLETLHIWKSASSTEIAAHLVQTLNSAGALLRRRVEVPLKVISNDLADLASRLDVEALARIADTMTVRLQEIRAAVEAGDLTASSPAVAAVNSALDEYEVLCSRLGGETLGSLAALGQRVGAVVSDLDDQMSHVMSVLQPGCDMGQFGSGITPTSEVMTAAEEAFRTLDKWLGSIVLWLRDLLEQIDVTRWSEQLGKLVDSVQHATQSLDAAMVNATLDVQKLFDRVGPLLDQMDTGALVKEVQTTIDGFASELKDRLSGVMGLVHGNINEAIAGIAKGTEAFDPEDVIDALRRAIDAVAAVLQDPSILAPLQEIRSSLETIGQELASISFYPLTDQVIRLIDDVTGLLRGIDVSQLSAPLQGALQAAVVVLPKDIAPVTNKLVDELNGLVESGPVALLISVQNEPQKLLDRVQNFQPAVLLGDALAEPFGRLRDELKSFQPRQLLAPAEAELEAFKDRLGKSANPGRMIAPLATPFRLLVDAFDELKPDKIVQAVEEAIAGAVDAVLKAVPLDDLLNEVTARVKETTQKLESVIGVGERLVRLLEPLRDLLGGFAGTQEQVKTWVDTILDRLAPPASASSVQQALADLRVTFDALRAASLAGIFDAGIAPVLTSLETLDARGRLTPLVQAYQAVPRQKLDLLPDSAEKTNLLAVLSRFDPMTSAFAAPFNALADLTKQISQAKANLLETLGDWDERYHGQSSISAYLRDVEMTADNLRQWLHDSLEGPWIQPLTTAFSVLESVRMPIGTLLSIVQAVVGEMQDKLTGLLRGPEALVEIHASLDGVIQRLRSPNLDLLRDRLKDQFDTIRAKLEEIDPSRLRQVIETRFTDMLGQITLDELMPEIGTLDETYADVVNRIEALDPSTLVVAVVQPEFDEAVTPLLQSFDLTAAFNSLIDRLRGLDGELKNEMNRANDAYRRLLAAIPS